MKMASRLEAAPTRLEEKIIPIITIQIYCMNPVSQRTILQTPRQVNYLLELFISSLTLTGE